MTSVGTILRSAREQQGRSMAEIAEDLCIMQRYLRAIEEDDVKTLPGVFFYKNFVKQYGAILGIDEAVLRPGVQALAAAEEEPALPASLPQSAAPVRVLDPIVAESNRRYFSNNRLGVSVAGLAVVLLACSGFYAWWNRPAEAAAVPPAPQPQVIQHEVIQQAPATTAAIPEQAPSAVEVSTSAEIGGINRVELNLSATEKTWLSITSEGKRIFSGFLEPSQTKTLTGLDVARMTVGNAGGLEVRLNGKPIGPIGKSGQVRVVIFTPDNYEVLPLTPPPAPSETL